MSEYSKGGYIPVKDWQLAPVVLNPDECLISATSVRAGRFECSRADHPTPTSDCTKHVNGIHHEKREARVTLTNRIRYPRATTQPLDARRVALAYNYPTSQYTGAGVTVGIVELGGAVNPTDLAAYCKQLGIPQAQVTVVPVGGAKPVSDGANGADGEVMLDVEVVAAIAPGAKQRVYFAPNTGAGFLAAIKQATTECDYVSISWGGPESSWDAATMDAYEAVFAAARAKGVTVFVASGDTGSKDGTRANIADFPASSPSVVGCGGTRLTLNADGSRAGEVTWNDNPTSSATGGGVSQHFPGRMVPDVAGNADPQTGYEVIVDGQSFVIGGTSAVAPLYAGLAALLREAYKDRFDFVNTILTNPDVCFDVTVGNNGGYKAGPGRDQVTGYGVVDGEKLLAVLTGGGQIPAPGGNPTPAPTPTPVPGGTTVTFIGTEKAALDTWAAGKLYAGTAKAKAAWKAATA